MQFSAAYRTYNADLPAFLHNRPRNFVMHVANRWSAAFVFETANIKQLDDRRFTVASPDSGNVYNVTFGTTASEMPRCGCEDWSIYHWPCKHFCAIFQNTSHNWNDLSALYRDSPFFTIDNDVIAGGSLQVPPIMATDNAQQCEDELHYQELSNTQQSSTSGESLQAAASNCRELLKQLTDYTYLCDNVEPLTQLQLTLSNAVSQLALHMPNDSGILLNTQVDRQRKKKRPIVPSANKYVY